MWPSTAAPSQSQRSAGPPSVATQEYPSKAARPRHNNSFEPVSLKQHPQTKSAFRFQSGGSCSAQIQEWKRPQLRAGPSPARAACRGPAGRGTEPRRGAPAQHSPIGPLDGGVGSHPERPGEHGAPAAPAGAALPSGRGGRHGARPAVQKRPAGNRLPAASLRPPGPALSAPPADGSPPPCASAAPHAGGDRRGAILS